MKFFLLHSKIEIVSVRNYCNINVYNVYVISNYNNGTVGQICSSNRKKTVLEAMTNHMTGHQIEINPATSLDKAY